MIYYGPEDYETLEEADDLETALRRVRYVDHLVVFWDTDDPGEDDDPIGLFLCGVYYTPEV